MYIFNQGRLIGLYVRAGIQVRYTAVFTPYLRSLMRPVHTCLAQALPFFQISPRHQHVLCSPLRKKADAVVSGPTGEGKFYWWLQRRTLTAEQRAARPRQRFLRVANTLRMLRASLSPQFAPNRQRAVQDWSPGDDVFIRRRSRL